jgi:hypothetical protein
MNGYTWGGDPSFVELVLNNLVFIAVESLLPDLAAVVLQVEVLNQ